MPTEALSTLGVPVHAVPDLATITREIRSALTSATPWLCTFVNPASVVVARREPAYVQALHRFDRVLPDGTGMVQAINLLHRVPAARISFDSTSLAPIAFQIAAEQGLTVALCGGKPGVAEQAAERISTTFRIKALAYSGFAGLQTTVDWLAAADPRMVVVGMGTMLQESVLLNLVASGWRGVGFTCGGYIDQVAQRYQYYPQWVNRHNLRFAYRLYNEPARLWRRYLLQYPLFLVWLGRELARKGR
jgi:N-acetylglucosaminyldiphosphoundecaprenol N-acetyl-beta-D-mannosaminyltransferase